MIEDPKLRFSDRVTSYVRARPGYPPQVIQLLRNECGLTRSSVVADVGSGTGMLSKMLCEVAGTVFGVEPNQEMRAAAQEYLSATANFISVDGAAENTALPATSVDLITVAQAFHWFNQSDSRHEFLRILKPNGWTAIIWNDRRQHGSRVNEAYEQLIQNFGLDYTQVQARGRLAIENLDRFFGHGQYKRASFPNSQSLDREGFVERALSASYMPAEGHSRYSEMLEQAQHIFDMNSTDVNRTARHVVLEYDTNVYYGQMT